MLCMYTYVDMLMDIDRFAWVGRRVRPPIRNAHFWRKLKSFLPWALSLGLGQCKHQKHSTAKQQTPEGSP